MKIGISMIYKRVDESAPNPGTFALECEKIGLESVWVGDHMLFHTAPKTPFPAGGPIPDHYAHFPEPFVVLAMAAATTKHLRIGLRCSWSPSTSHAQRPNASRAVDVILFVNDNTLGLETPLPKISTASTENVANC
jgi:hypothetical protein